jgi:hypothetical protein
MEWRRIASKILQGKPGEIKHQLTEVFIIRAKQTAINF